VALLDSDMPLNIHGWCDRQDSLAVIGRYVQLDRRGMGCCSFGWHHDDGKDSRSSFAALVGCALLVLLRMVAWW
jgi:hypothetical protein